MAFTEIASAVASRSELHHLGHHLLATEWLILPTLGFWREVIKKRLSIETHAPVEIPMFFVWKAVICGIQCSPDQKITDDYMPAVIALPGWIRIEWALCSELMALDGK
jgi:hypothetical protein